MALNQMIEMSWWGPLEVQKLNTLLGPSLLSV